MARDRCGYTHDVSRFPDIGEACCWRPVWRDGHRCVWHADEANKPTEALVRRVPARGERFDGAIVRESTVTGVEGFGDCTLVDADFTRADASGIDFTGADLREATFRDANVRGTTFTRANLEDADVRDADLRGTRLDRAKLDEINVTDSRVDRNTVFGERTTYEVQLTRTRPREERREVFESAIWTYRTLQRLASRNARREQMFEYFKREKDLRRRFAWDEGRYRYALKTEVERWLTGYGHHPWRILGVSLLLIVLCAVLYPLVGGIREVAAERTITYTIGDPFAAPVGEAGRVFFESLYFSVTTFATLGYGDLQPVGGGAQLLAGVESLLGGLLMALLVVVLFQRISWVR